MAGSSEIEGISFVDYVDEGQLDDVMALVGRDLSEPYSIFTYRYFLARYPELCIIAVNEKGDSIGCVVGKIDNEEGEDENRAADDDDGGGGPEQQVPQQQQQHQSNLPRNGGGGGGEGGGAAAVYSDDVRIGYIGMLAVMDTYRRRGIGKALVQRILQRFQHKGCVSAVLECERSNVQAQQLYQDIFGFVREELLVRYYINTCDAYRLRLWF